MGTTPIASHESLQSIARPVAEEVAVASGTTRESGQDRHPVVGQRSGLSIDAMFQIFDSSTPLRQILECPTIGPRLAGPVGVHRTNGGFALSCEIVIVYAITEAGR